MNVLERINTAGMAVHELDRIPDEQEDFKSKVRAQVVRLLLNPGPTNPADSKDSETEPKARAASAT